MTLEAGFGRADITPSLPVMLAGFGDRTAPANEVHDHLEAHALYLEEKGVRLCLIVCDLLGMSIEFSDPVRKAVAEALDTGLDAVLTACTHTHSGPNALKGGEALGWATPEGYEEVLAQGCRKAAISARESADDAFLHFARAALSEGLSVNRRGNPYDPWFSILDVRRPDDSHIGVLANFSIHPVSLGPEWLAVSCDWVRPFRERMEAEGGGAAILLSGSLGDVNPPGWESYYGPTGAYGLTESLGHDLAREAIAVLPRCERVEGAISVAASRNIEASVAPTPLTELAGIKDSVEFELIEWSLGSVRLVSIPGEAFHAFGKAVDEARGFRTLLAGISPSWQGYLPHPFGSGYEETVSFGEPAVNAVFDALTEVPPGQ